MILNKADFGHLVRQLNPFNRMSVWRHPALANCRWPMIRATITDYLFNGGTICNKHNVHRCYECMFGKKPRR
jgi:hypothetical protein